tara:strand:- start:151 stop:507 length:357 start_codon:yes stop_codon:yes gene_type:complete
MLKRCREWEDDRRCVKRPNVNELIYHVQEDINKNPNIPIVQKNNWQVQLGVIARIAIKHKARADTLQSLNDSLMNRYQEMVVQNAELSANNRVVSEKYEATLREKNNQDQILARFRGY